MAGNLSRLMKKSIFISATIRATTTKIIRTITVRRKVATLPVSNSNDNGGIKLQ